MIPGCRDCKDHSDHEGEGSESWALEDCDTRQTKSSSCTTRDVAYDIIGHVYLHECHLGRRINRIVHCNGESFGCHKRTQNYAGLGILKENIPSVNFESKEICSARDCKRRATFDSLRELESFLCPSSYTHHRALCKLQTTDGGKHRQSGGCAIFFFC